MPTPQKLYWHCPLGIYFNPDANKTHRLVQPDLPSWRTAIFATPVRCLGPGFITSKNSWVLPNWYWHFMPCSWHLWKDIDFGVDFLLLEIQTNCKKLGLEGKIS
jgi:hypothetical protein